MSEQFFQLPDSEMPEMPDMLGIDHLPIALPVLDLSGEVVLPMIGVEAPEQLPEHTPIEPVDWGVLAGIPFTNEGLNGMSPDQQQIILDICEGYIKGTGILGQSRGDEHVLPTLTHDAALKFHGMLRRLKKAFTHPGQIWNCLRTAAKWSASDFSSQNGDNVVPFSDIQAPNGGDIGDIATGLVCGQGFPDPEQQAMVNETIAAMINDTRAGTIPSFNMEDLQLLLKRYYYGYEPRELGDKPDVVSKLVYILKRRMRRLGKLRDW